MTGPEALGGTGVRLVKVTVYETENGIAEEQGRHALTILADIRAAWQPGTEQ